MSIASAFLGAEQTTCGAAVRPLDLSARRRAAGTRSAGLGRRPRQDPPPAKLLEQAQRIAADRGSWEWFVADAPTDRAYHLLERDASTEAWLIIWPPGGQLELHDHGESHGAFWVAEGMLEERYAPRPNTTMLFGTRYHATSSGICFDGGYLHDVRNAGGLTAVSVHVYSPPLVSMTYYRRDGRALVPDRVEHRGEGGWEP